MYCVVFNASHEPLSIVSLRRGLVLTLKGKAVVWEELKDRVIRTSEGEFPAPASVLLKEYVKTGSKYYGEAQLSQKNLFMRDDFTCQYCGRHVLEFAVGEVPTRDHVHPQSRGGLDRWDNVVTACSTCNHKKDNRTPEEAGLTLLRQPWTPMVNQILGRRSKYQGRRPTRHGGRKSA